MTPEEIKAKIAEHSEMCQTWESAVPIGLDGGMFYLSSIYRGEESVGTVHVCIWDRQTMGRTEAARFAARDLMRMERLDRLVGEIDQHNYLALNFAKRVGFKVIGVVRQRKDTHGQTHNVVLMDALPGDLELVQQA